MFAYEPLTLDRLQDRLHSEGIDYKIEAPRFPRSKLHVMLADRSYIGEVRFRGQWHPGRHPPIIDRGTWERVQAVLGGHAYSSHEMVYAGDTVVCAHCGRAVTGECKAKKTKAGVRHYVYYRCSGYNAPGHPRVRVTEAALDGQMLALFEQVRV